MNYYNTIVPSVFICVALAVTFYVTKDKTFQWRKSWDDLLFLPVVLGIVINASLFILIMCIADCTRMKGTISRTYPIASIYSRAEQSSTRETTYFLVYYSEQSQSNIHEYYKIMVNRGKGFQAERYDVYNGNLFIEEKQGVPFLETYYSTDIPGRLSRFILDDETIYRRLYDKVYLPPNSIMKEYKL